MTIGATLNPVDLASLDHEIQRFRPCHQVKVRIVCPINYGGVELRTCKGLGPHDYTTWVNCYHVRVFLW
jgi:hypothetical protein